MATANTTHRPFTPCNPPLQRYFPYLPPTLAAISLQPDLIAASRCPTTALCFQSCRHLLNLALTASLSSFSCAFFCIPYPYSKHRPDSYSSPSQPQSFEGTNIAAAAMFSTFTGNSRRPRNVNLSGGVGNPFANTSWSPSNVSSTTKTLSDAQADREKRQAERQRLKAASRIQRTWRGHKARSRLADHRRAAFDELYNASTSSGSADRLHKAFNILLSFCKPAQPDDLRRLLQYTSEAVNVKLESLFPHNTHASRVRRLVEIIISALHSSVRNGYGCTLSPSASSANMVPSTLAKELRGPLHLATHIIQSVPHALGSSQDKYFATLARISQQIDGSDWLDAVLGTLSVALQTDSQCMDPRSKALRQSTLISYSTAYISFTSHFLTREKITLFEKHIARFATIIDANKLCDAIAHIYTLPRSSNRSADDLLWLLAHYIHLTRNQTNSQAGVGQIRSVFVQLSALSSEISARVTPKSLPNDSDEGSDGAGHSSIDPYLSHHLLWLISNEGTSKILRDFTAGSIRPSRDALQSTSLLAGYLLTLLQSFPDSADDVRMRLFLEQVTTQEGPVPTILFLWQMVQETAVFQSLHKESEQPLGILKRYLQGSPQLEETAEDQEWRTILLFLELYTFILRLSDDEDFFSGINPSPLRDTSSLSRIQACSLSFEDVKSLTLFLKNVAFTLYYKARELSPTLEESHTVVQSRLDSYLGADPTQSNDSAAPPTVIQLKSTKLDFDSLREIISSAMTMLYERDSRKPFLPKDHWLVTDKLQKDDFVSAVIAEEERQRQEEIADSDEEMEDGDDTISSFDRDINFTFAGQRLSRHARMERLRAQQMRAQRERRLAEMGPKLEILKHMPFAVPFDTRVMIFRQFIELDIKRRDSPIMNFNSMTFAKHAAQIRRGRLFEDAFEELYKVGDGLKDPIQITFVDQFDQPEAGIDGGGVTKEFLISVTSEAFGDQDGSLNMFTSSPDGLLYPNPTAIDTIKETMREGKLTESSPEWRHILNAQLQRYEFLGRIVGKCMYEGILVDLNFAGFFLLKWPSSGPKEENNYKGSINDLRDMDEELYKGMLRLKNYTGDVSELGIDFTVTDQVSMPGAPIKTVTKLLVANGDQVYVTNDNRPLYISYMARHRLVVQSAVQTAAFLRGLRAIIRPSWLSMFNQSELQRLVGGDSSEIDIEDLRQNTIYSGVYEIGDDNQEHPTIKLFWKVLRGFTDAQRRDLLKYVSSTPRAPLLGFSQLRPRFSIRDAGTDEDRLPSTSTCVNLLKLPRYKNERTLREKLLYAITSGAGFDLS
ncbi:hypothetical protein NLG97_g8165 [Lecanicillium saksenae]|uniref:Uncharacterized protein n=1 Tax=Lecanicillium saksenae TaxID=468837 RepID=A0ACC1QM34_9HYPO|nr:hypothetical protein NLG97_g8165 [Lecanicillium saksenae]